MLAERFSIADTCIIKNSSIYNTSRTLRGGKRDVKPLQQIAARKAVVGKDGGRERIDPEECF